MSRKTDRQTRASNLAARASEIQDRFGWLDYSTPEAARELAGAALDLARVVELLAREVAKS